MLNVHLSWASIRVRSCDPSWAWMTTKWKRHKKRALSKLLSNPKNQRHGRGIDEQDCIARTDRHRAVKRRPRSIGSRGPVAVRRLWDSDAQTGLCQDGHRSGQDRHAAAFPRRLENRIVRYPAQDRGGWGDFFSCE